MQPMLRKTAQSGCIFSCGLSLFHDFSSTCKKCQIAALSMVVTLALQSGGRRQGAVPRTSCLSWRATAARVSQIFAQCLVRSQGLQSYHAAIHNPSSQHSQSRACAFDQTVLTKFCSQQTARQVQAAVQSAGK